MNSTRKLEINLTQVVQIKVCHQPGSKLFIYGKQSELQDNAFPFAWCSRVTSRTPANGELACRLVCYCPKCYSKSL